MSTYRIYHTHGNDPMTPEVLAADLKRSHPHLMLSDDRRRREDTTAAAVNGDEKRPSFPTTLGSFAFTVATKGLASLLQHDTAWSGAGHGLDMWVVPALRAVCASLLNSAHGENDDTLWTAVLVLLESQHNRDSFPADLPVVKVLWVSDAEPCTAPRRTTDPWLQPDNSGGYVVSTEDSSLTMRKVDSAKTAKFVDYWRANVIFWFNGTIFKLDRDPFGDRYNHRRNWKLQLRWVGTQSALVALFDAAVKCMTMRIVAEENSIDNIPTINVYRTEHFGPAFGLRNEVPRREWNTLYISEKLRTDIIEDARRFYRDVERYVRIGMPYRRCQLWKGPPGNGKSSAVIALASHFRLPLYLLTSSDMSNLSRLLNVVRAPAIVLIEDADVIFPTREAPNLVVADAGANNAESKPESGPHRARADPFASSDKAVNFSDLLNALDGVCSKSGILVIMTTNCPEKIDPALKRGGRVDVEFDFPLATLEAAQWVLKQHYGRVMDEETTARMNAKLEAEFKPDAVCLANLQRACFLYDTEYEKAVEQMIKESRM